MTTLSEAARLYQLKKGHVLNGILAHGKQETTFKYGLLNSDRSKTTYVHGIEGGQTVIAIETVCAIAPEIGDKITLVSGQKGRVELVAVEILDDVQLRFVSYEKVEKITRITINTL